MTKKGLLKCTVSDGLFPQEKVVFFKAAQGERIELFAPSNLIRDNKLEVSILEENQGVALVRLPATPTNTSSVVAVPEDQVTEALLV